MDGCGDRTRLGGRRSDKLDRLLAGLAASTSTDAALGSFHAFIEPLGFSSVACLSIQPGRFAVTDCILANTRDSRWGEIYLARRQHLHDPVLRRALTSTQPFAWSDLNASELAGAEAREVMRLACAFGMPNGFTVPIHDAAGTATIVSLAGQERRGGKEARAVLTMASLCLANALARLTQAGKPVAAGLTSRELEIMQWIAAGKSDWQIGRILNISAKTVNYHVENAKRKCGVATRTQAVAALLRQHRLTH